MGLIQLPTFKMRPDEQIVPLAINHLELLELQEHELQYVETIPHYLDYIFENSELGWSWAGIGQGKVVCCFGLRPIWKGVAEAWLVPGKGLEDHARTLLVGARTLFDQAVSDSDITRLQIYVKEENEVALRFAKAIGFDVESKLRKFGPEGADYIGLVRFSK